MIVLRSGESGPDSGSASFWEEAIGIWTWNLCPTKDNWLRTGNLECCDKD